MIIIKKWKIIIQLKNGRVVEHFVNDYFINVINSLMLIDSEISYDKDEIINVTITSSLSEQEKE